LGKEEPAFDYNRLGKSEVSREIIVISRGTEMRVRYKIQTRQKIDSHRERFARARGIREDDARTPEEAWRSKPNLVVQSSLVPTVQTLAVRNS
jgi:hypothetical protein